MIARGAASGDWSALVAEGLHADRFLTLLMALLSSSSSSIAGAAASCMLTSMRVPGAVTHGLLHPLAFFDLTKTLRLLLSTSTDARQGHSRTNKARPAKKGARRRPNARKNADEDEDDDEDEEQPDSSLESDRRGNSHSLAAPSQLELLSELELLLRSVPLRSYPEVLSQLIEMLALTVSSQPRALAALRCTLREEHGAFETTVQSVMKALLPLLLLSTEAEAKEALIAQHEAVKFVVSLCGGSSHGESTSAVSLEIPEAERPVLLEVVQALLQHASNACPDRAENRSRVCEALSRLLLQLPSSVSSRYVHFLWRFSRTVKVSARTFAVEMAATVLEAAAGRASSPLHADGTPQTLWRLLIQHMADRATGVRIKSLSCLGTLLSLLHECSGGGALLRLMQQPLLLAGSPFHATTSDANEASPNSHTSPMSKSVPSSPMGSVHTPETSPSNSVGPRDSRRSANISPSASLVQAAASMDASLPVLGTSLQQRCLDERPAVRRAALAAIEAWVRVSGLQLSPSQLSLLSQRCQDTSPAIRKQAARSLNALLRNETQSSALRAAWINGVLPLSQDVEASVSEACFDSVLEMILGPLARSKGDGARVVNQAFWVILEDLRADTTPLLRHCVKRLAALGKLPTSLGASLVRLLAPEGNAVTACAAGPGRLAAWGLLIELSNLPPDHRGEHVIDSRAVLRAWEQIKGSRDNGEEATAVLRVLISLARRGDVNPTVSTALAAELYSRLCAFDSPIELAVLLVQACSSLPSGVPSDWADQLMEKCGERLAAATESVERMKLYLLVAGELALAHPSCVSHQVVATIQAIIRAGDSSETYQVLSATSVIALGKLCVADADLTQRLLPMFMKELASNPQPAVRNNALVALYDLIKKHTALLDRHIASIALAITDEAAFVRRQALMLFTQLLLEDYIKWRPTLLRAFCAALADKEPSQREAARSALFDMLLPRAPLLSFNSFLGLLFQLNGCTHAVHHASPLPAAEKVAFEMSGEQQQRRRLTILRALLSNMTDEQRLQITAKLCHDVLAIVPDGQLSLEASHWVIADALLLLACKDIKLSASGTSGIDEEEVDPTQNAATAAATAKNRLLSLVARKATVEAIVPVVVELKRYLEQQRSPLLRDIFLFLRELLKDHKQHLQDIFSRDRQLAAEIEYDLRQLQAQHTPRALQPLTPEGHVLTPTRTPHGSIRSVGSKTSRKEFSRVLTPDGLKQLSVPRLRTDRRSSVEDLGSGLPKSGSGGARRSSLPPVPRLLPRSTENEASVSNRETPDVMMASPFKDAPPPKQWNVIASPDGVSGSPSLSALAKKQRCVFDEEAV